MARKTKVITVCDRHRGDVDAAGSVEIVIDGDRRKVDLCAEHLAEFRKLARPWLSSPGARAPKSAGPRRRKAPATRARRGRGRGGDDLAAIRAWARENGYEVSDRGRLPGAVREAFAAAKG